MDLRPIANAVTSTINANTLVTLRRSTGYTIGAGLKQVPTYAADQLGYGQIQALDNEDLKQIDGLNIQGTIRALYVRGELAGVIEPDSTGGDLVEIDGRIWLVVKVIEHWRLWCKLAIVLQDG